MERYVKAGSSFLQKQYFWHLMVTLLFCMTSGFFVSFQNLSPEQAAKVMEMFVIFAGILLFTPLFLPEQNREIWLLEKSKKTPLWKLYLIRIFLAMLVLTCIVTLFVAVLHAGNSEFQTGKLWLGSFLEMLFLGSIGFCISGITNQVVLGYMASVLYFICNIGGSKYFGQLALFQMMKGEFDFMPWLAAGAALLFAAGIVIREQRNQ